MKSNSGRIRPGSISVSKSADLRGTVRGGSQIQEDSKRDLGEGDLESNGQEWLRIEHVGIDGLDVTRLRVVHWIFGLLALVIVLGLGLLTACSMANVPTDAIEPFLATVLALLAGGVGAVTGFLFGKEVGSKTN